MHRRVLSLQMGARRNYVAARHLEAAGMLHSLVCDAAWGRDRVPLVVRKLGEMRPSLGGTIARRTIAGIDPSRIHASIWPTLARISARATSAEHANSIVDDVLGWTVPTGSLNQIDAVVNYFGNGGRFLDRARKRGKIIVTDFISHPRYWRILQEERDRWPGWEEAEADDESRRWYEARVERLVRLSDLYLCPSPGVAAALADVPGFEKSRVRLVPYGVSGVHIVPPRCVEGRILFAASATTLAKGVMYLAKAAALLRQRNVHADIVVAGSVPSSWIDRPELAGLRMLGSLDRTRMAEEFAQADVFCLPSLAEGSATSIYEALANGVPVVTTASSGSVVEHGREGLIVPERDGEAIADAIAAIILNRERRTIMAANARAAATRYSDARCGDLFTEIIREALSMSPRR